MSGQFEISTDHERFDLALIHEFLVGSYWAEGRTREVVERSVRHSPCFGVFDGDRQIAFARVITDRAVFGYLADVFVVPAYRGKGISKGLMAAILEHPDIKDLKVFLLVGRQRRKPRIVRIKAVPRARVYGRPLIGRRSPSPTALGTDTAASIIAPDAVRFGIWTLTNNHRVPGTAPH